MSYRENYKLIDWSKPLEIDQKERPQPKRSDLPLPYVRSDYMTAAQHPITGMLIDSKSRFERITKDAGYITVGDDPSRLRPTAKPRPDKQAIRKSIEKAKARLSA